MNNRPALSILHLTDDNRGGSQRYLIDLCRSQTPDIRHFVLRAGPTSMSLHDPARERVLVLDAPFEENDHGAVLATVIDELGIGCIHAHALRPLLAAAAAADTGDARLAPTPSCVTLHDLSCIDPRLFTAPAPVPHADPSWIARCRPVLARAAAVIVPSSFVADMVRTHYPGIEPVVIPNGIAPAPRVDLPIAPPWPATSRVFAVVGALGPHKGADMLLRVIDALADPAIVCVVIGFTEAQPAAGWLVPGRCYVHGPYKPDELPGLLAAYRARLAYFPNLIPESFSYVLSEVWDAGVPALVPGAGVQGDRVRATGGGWVLDDPRDPAAVAATIARLLSPECASDLGRVAQGLGRVCATGAAVDSAACVEGAAGTAHRTASDAAGAASSAVPRVEDMRAAVEALYREHGRPAAGDPDGGWARLRHLLGPRLVAAADDLALDAEWPALVRETHTLREWTGKLADDVSNLEHGARGLQAALDSCSGRALALERDIATLRERNAHVEADAAALKTRNDRLEREHAELAARPVGALTARNAELERHAQALREWTVHVEADIATLKSRNAQLDDDVVALTRRNLELETDIVALKERNTLVEADLFAFSQRNARIERDAASLQQELAAATERLARSARQLDAAATRATTAEAALHRLPAPLHNWLLRHVR